MRGANQNVGSRMKLRAEVRLLTEKEARFLKNQKTGLLRRRRTLWQRAMLGFAVIFGLLALLTILAEPKNPRFILGFWGILGGLIAVPAFIQEWLRLSKKIDEYAYAIAAGHCEDLAIAASRMWEFEEEEDEGTCYAFELESRGVVFVAGQDFYPSARFPNTDFSIVTFRGKGGQDLDGLIEKRGEKITPEKTIPARKKAGLNIPKHGSFFEGTLENVYGKIRKT